MSKTPSFYLGRGLTYAILIIGSLIAVIPLLWSVSTSLKTIDQLTIFPPQWIPNPIALDNYAEVFRQIPVMQYFGNTLVIVVAWVLGATVTCSFVAYGFARTQFRGRDTLFLVLLSTLMMPYVVRLIPLFMIYKQIGWINTFLPLTVPQLLGRNAFYIFLLRQFFIGIPNELTDASRIDGCSHFGIWWRIILPLSRPALATVAVFAFQAAWDDFLAPLVYMGGNPELRTLALGLFAFRAAPGQVAMTHLLMSMSIMMIIPILIIFAFGQRYFIQGVTMSGLKG
ncbi:MAG: carbohydrate ABC transporter permease [Anaerolineae bacterium]|nr:carbohydrate ABC transporter permease [Anaerolineae bacterium]